MIVKQKFVKFLLNLLWKLSDDIVYTTSLLQDIYDDVPEDIRKEVVEEYSIHYYNNENGKFSRVINWLNSKK